MLSSSEYLKLWGYCKCCKSKRFSSKNSNPKIFCSPTFLRGFASDFTKNVTGISNWQLACMFRPSLYRRKYRLSWRVAGGARRKFPQIVQSSYYQWRWCVITYKEVALTLIPRTRNQARNTTECFEDLYDNFNHLMGDIKNYIKQRFATFKEPSLCDFTVFDAKLWPDNLAGFGQKEISNLVTYHQK